QYAELFYEAQEWAFGHTSNYYAADPFHEGGIRPSDGSLTDDVVASELASSLIKYDANGVWVIQAWHSNPTNELLHGLEGVREDHALVLDLCALEAPKWNRTVYGEDGEGGTTLDNIEFNGTPWVWCMLENYGGNPSMDGELQNIIDQLNIANQTAEHLKGIGIIAEATLDNPALYNMLFDMGWRSVELKTWLKEYTTARYGRYSENVEKAWELIEESVYNKQNGWYRTTPWILTAIPEWRQYNQTMPYDYVKLEQALELLLKDYDLLCGSEGYRYDLVEIMQHIVSHYACMMHNEVYSAFTAKNLTAFRAARAKFEACFPIMNDVLGCRTEWLAGEWIRRAEDWGDILDNDFARDNLVENAKMLITSWADQMALRAIPDYAVRHYEGMLIDLYQARWTVWLDKQDANLANGTPIKQLGLDDYYYVYREWIYNGKTYTKTANEDLNHLREVATNVLANATTIKASMTGYSYSFEILAKFQQKFALIDKTRYSESQIATINEVMARLNQAENASLTQEDYYTLLTDAYKADVIFANPQGHAHNYQAETTPNADNLAAGKTCAEYAKYYKVCSVCGAKSTETYDYIAGGKLDHEYSYVSDGEAGHHKDCDNCSDVTATENHDFQGGNTCKDCGYTKPVASSSSSAPSSSSQEPSSSSSVVESSSSSQAPSSSSSKQEVSSSSSEVVSSSSSSQQVSSSSVTASSSSKAPQPAKRGGCNGSVGSVGLVTLLGLTAVAVLKKKSKR
ncbi:MAG: alpha-N-acetylglucosaminidase C-terminal domain-containing protein, partial [Clostridia bacterium]|nr:alpha-N-acetylglucosaminidase C-terminal domain-containing protein [Clostridia bacterium]